VHAQTHPGAGHDCPLHVCLEVIRQAHASRADIVSACQCLLQKRASSVRAARHPRAAGLAAARHAGRVCGHDGAAGAGPGVGAVGAGCTWTSAVRRFEECDVAVGVRRLTFRLAAALLTLHGAEATRRVWQERRFSAAGYTPEAGPSELRPGTYYLTQVDALYRRFYARRELQGDADAQDQ